MTQLLHIPYGMTQHQWDEYINLHYIDGNVRQCEHAIPTELLLKRFDHLRNYQLDVKFASGQSTFEVGREIEAIDLELRHRKRVEYHLAQPDSKDEIIDEVERARDQLNATLRVHNEVLTGVRTTPSFDQPDEMPAGHVLGMPDAAWWAANPDTARMVSRNDDLPHSYLDLRSPVERAIDDAMVEQIAQGIGVMPVAIDVFTLSRADRNQPTMSEKELHVIDAMQIVLDSIDAVATRDQHAYKLIDAAAFLLINLFETLAIAYPDTPVKMLNDALDMASSKSFVEFASEVDAPTLY